MLNSLIHPPLFKKMRTAFLRKGLIGVMYLFIHSCLYKIVRILTWRQNNGTYNSIATVYVRRKYLKRNRERMFAALYTLNACVFVYTAFEEEKLNILRRNSCSPYHVHCNRPKIAMFRKD